MNRGLLTRAAESREPLEMIYQSKSGSLTQRTVKILEVGKGQFLAYCYLRRQRRMFTIANILSISRISQKRGA